MRAREQRLGRVAGLDVLAGPSAVAGTALMALIFAALGRYVFHHGIANALVGGVLLALLHWVSEVAHNLGHATAARRTGHPMIGGRLGFLLVLGTSLYPPNEPELPASVHIRRALGGPIGSAVLTAVVGVAALILAQTSAGWVALVWFLDNLLIFTLGAFIPLGFNDGSTLIYWMREARARRA
jgi:hypothetical protein